VWRDHTNASRLATVAFPTGARTIDTPAHPHDTGAWARSSADPVRRTTPRAIRRILAPTDFSASAHQAVATAFELAQTFGAKLMVLHVVEPQPYLVDSHALSHQSPRLLKAIEEQAKRELEHLPSQPPDAQVEIARRVLVGVPLPQA
jgi:hypothetical protein